MATVDELEAERRAVLAELSAIAGPATAEATAMAADRMALALRRALVRVGLGDRVGEIATVFADELAATLVGAVV